MRRAGRRKRRGGEEEPHADERWLITYSDMITLLMALFIVLYAMSTIDVVKFQALQQSLSSAFSGVLPSSNGIKPAAGGEKQDHAVPSSATVPLVTPAKSASEAAKRAQENEEFGRIKQIIEKYAARHGFAADVKVSITRRGLVVSLLTDNILFDSGSAELSQKAAPLLQGVSAAIERSTTSRPILVEGHTDNVPIHSIRYPTNWELSTARATSVVRYLIAHGMPAGRLGASGYADLHPRATNTTVAGRALNRRVEIVLLRTTGAGAGQGSLVP